MVNAPIRGGEDLKSWPLVLEKTDIANLGGKSSEKGLELTDADLIYMAQGGYGVIIPVDIDRAISEYEMIINRMLYFGVKIVGIRYGNEQGNSPELTGVPDNEVASLSLQKAAEYYHRCQPFRDALSELIEVQNIYSGAYPHPTQGERFQTWKRVWTDTLLKLIETYDAIDIHIYDQALPDPMDMIMVKDYFNAIPNSIYVIEAGCKPTDDNSIYYQRTIRTWDLLNGCLKSKDVRGAQLMENTKRPIGLIYKGVVTSYGYVYKGIPRLDAPRVVAVKSRFGFGSLKWWWVTDHRGEVHSVRSSSSPVKGSFV